MNDAASHRQEPQRYAARVVERPRVDAAGVRHGGEGATEEVRWSRICWAIAAEIGEPEGVRTIVFDLVTRDDAGFQALRLEAEPGPDAIALARAVVCGLGDERKIPSVRCLATDGITARWYPDLGSFEEDAAREVTNATRDS